MTINYWLLPIVVVLLYFPRQALRWGRIGSHRSRHSAAPWDERDRADLKLRFGEELTKGRNWIDFFRALAGGLALFLMAIRLPDNPSTREYLVLFWIHCAVLLLAVVTQTLRKEGRIMLFPPIFFLLGLSFPLIGPIAAIIALVLILTANLAIPSPGIFLVLYGFVAGGLGAIFQPLRWEYGILMFVLAFAPVLLSLMMRKRLVPISRRPRGASR